MVNTRLRSYFGEAGWVNEQISGVSYLFFIRNLRVTLIAGLPWLAVLTVAYFGVMRKRLASG